jgi:hypothetical protein
LAKQEAAHARAPAAQRDEAYFRQRIGEIRTAEDLVADRTLLRVALTAFGLAADLPNKAFITRVLDSDTTDRRSFAGRLADKRYLELAQAFGFRNPFGPQIARPGVAEGIVQRFRELRFEEAVGATDDNMRLALSLQRDLRRLATQPFSEEARWFTVLGTPSLRRVFETAYNLPPAFASLDLDRQVEVLQSRTARLTGNGEIAQFTDPARMDRLINQFFVGAQIGAIQASGPRSGALMLLQSMPPLRTMRPGG